jgi:hypothetical protein
VAKRPKPLHNFHLLPGRAGTVWLSNLTILNISPMIPAARFRPVMTSWNYLVPGAWILNRLSMTMTRLNPRRPWKKSG